MANYTPSNLVKAQAMLLNAFQTSETRFRKPQTFLEFVKNGQIMFPSYEMLRTREDRTVEAYYKKRTARALGAARTHNHTGTKGDSGILTPSWTTYADKFTMSLKQADNNIFNFQEMFDNEVLNVVANMAEGLETASVNKIFASRSTVNAAAIEGSFNGVTFAYEISEATVGTRAIQITTTVMDFLKYSGNATIFCDSIAFNKFRFQAAQGISNATNLSFQFQGVTFVHSPALTALASGIGYTKGYWTAVPEGTIGALPWIPKQNKMGVNTTVNTYGSLLNPVDSLTYGVHSYETRADDTATNGYTQDVTTEFQVSVDVALEVAPLSVAGETTLLAFALI